VPAPGVTLYAGQTNVFQYSGPTTTLLNLLASTHGKVTAVSFRNPGGFWIIHQPGSPGGEGLIVMTNATVSIVVTVDVRLDW
jgi:hypothetical protein